MNNIIRWLGQGLGKLLPWSEMALTPLPARERGKLWLSPEAFLRSINGPAIAAWALAMAAQVHPRPTRGPGGRPPVYQDTSILLMAVIQTAWRMSYADIVDYVAAHEALALLLGFTTRKPNGQLRVICQSQYWERRAALGILPFLFFFLALVAQLVRLGVITGRELIVDSTRLRAWWHADSGAAWSRYAGKATIFGYKVHTVLCHQADLPVFVLITPANVHDAVVGWLIVLAAVVLFGFRVVAVYADAAYFDRRFFTLVYGVLGATPAVDYNLRRQGKRKLATLPFLRYWWQRVLGPRSAIERHFAWLKRYFGLKYFQCHTFIRVSQFVLLTYVVVAGVALAAQRHQRPDLLRSRSGVLAHARP